MATIEPQIGGGGDPADLLDPVVPASSEPEQKPSLLKRATSFFGGAMGGEAAPAAAPDEAQPAPAAGAEQEEPAPSSDPADLLETAQATPGGKAATVGRGVVTGATRSAATAAGAIAGATLMALVPIPGARIIGAIVGAGGG